MMMVMDMMRNTMVIVVVTMVVMTMVGWLVMTHVRTYVIIPPVSVAKPTTEDYKVLRRHHKRFAFGWKPGTHTAHSVA